jgi:hypothetical protein
MKVGGREPQQQLKLRISPRRRTRESELRRRELQEVEVDSVELTCCYVVASKGLRVCR